MNRLLLIPCIVLAFSVTAHAGDLYLCVDKNGNEIISSVLKEGMKCQLKETFQKPSLEEWERQEHLERQKTITEREKAITEQEQAKADQERAKAAASPVRKPNELCERECKIDRSSCESDCNRNTMITYGGGGGHHDHGKNSGRADCLMNCLNYQKTCIDRCYY
jgi:hypothetical protein